MDAFTLLKQDHRKVRELFQSLLETSNRAEKTRERVFDELKMELTVHSKIEEDHLYPALRDAKETRDLVQESLHEHSEVEKMLSDIASMPKTSKEWIDEVQKLHDAVEHHVLEEERQLFPRAQKVCSKDQIERLGADLEKEKKELMKH